MTIKIAGMDAFVRDVGERDTAAQERRKQTLGELKEILGNNQVKAAVEIATTLYKGKGLNLSPSGGVTTDVSDANWNLSSKRSVPVGVLKAGSPPDAKYMQAITPDGKLICPANESSANWLLLIFTPARPALGSSDEFSFCSGPVDASFITPPEKLVGAVDPAIICQSVDGLLPAILNSDVMRDQANLKIVTEILQKYGLMPK